MAPFRYLTLVWPGLPWLWLRGSLSGLVLALAFAVSLDVAILATWIWPDLVEHSFTISAWTATTVIWVVSVVSAASAFPPPIQAVDRDETDKLFIKARDAYLARDWIQAETRLQELLALAPTDGEAQLLLGTLLRRVGRPAEARQALEKLARSDSGAPWRTAIAAELARLDADSAEVGESAEPVVLPLRDASAPAPGRTAAA